MIETVFTLPFIMVVVVLIMYLGWNFRRLAVLTNVDRHAVWEQVTPGSPGPDIQRVQQDMRNPRLNEAFFGFNNDNAARLDEWRESADGYTPESHQQLRDMQADETYSYFDEFLDNNPRAIRERFVAEHEHVIDGFAWLNLADTMRNREGHSRLNGDWRYVNGIRPDGDDWEPAHRRVTPGDSLREVFFAEIDDGLQTYENSGNNLARAIRRFYLQYPGYRGPDIEID